MKDEKEQLDVDNSELVRNIKQLGNENEQLKYQTAKIDTFKRQRLEAQEEKDRAVKKLGYYEQYLNEHYSDKDVIREITDKLNEELVLSRSEVK